jgi:hypothetical protein
VGAGAVAVAVAAGAVCGGAWDGGAVSRELGGTLDDSDRRKSVSTSCRSELQMRGPESARAG